MPGPFPATFSFATEIFPLEPAQVGLATTLVEAHRLRQAKHSQLREGNLSVKDLQMWQFVWWSGLDKDSFMDTPMDKLLEIIRNFLIRHLPFGVMTYNFVAQSIASVRDSSARFVNGRIADPRRLALEHLGISLGRPVVSWNRRTKVDDAAMAVLDRDLPRYFPCEIERAEFRRRLVNRLWGLFLDQSQLARIVAFHQHNAVLHTRDLQKLDGPGIKLMVDRMRPVLLMKRDHASQIFDMVDKAATFADVDTDGSYRRWAHRIPRALLSSLPGAVANFNSGILAKVLCLPNACARRFLAIMCDMARCRFVSSYGRVAERIYDSVASQASGILNMLQLVLEPGETISSLLKEDQSFQQLEVLAARLLAASNKHEKRRAITSRMGRADPVVSLLVHLNGMIIAGCFPGIPSGTRLDAKRLHQHMFEWANSDPVKYSEFPREQRVLRKSPLDDNAIQELLRIAKSKKEIAYIQLSSWSGLRAGGLAHALMNDFWDAEKNSVRENVEVLEKNSDIRQLRFGATKRSTVAAHALAEYILQEHDGKSRYLFPHPRKPDVPHKEFANGTLRKLCRRLGLRGSKVYNHHQFRKNVVNRHKRHKGARIEDAARFLGHKNPATTFNRYWTEIKDLLDTTEGSIRSDADPEKEELQRQVQRLKRELADLRAAGPMQTSDVESSGGPGVTSDVEPSDGSDSDIEEAECSNSQNSMQTQKTTKTMSSDIFGDL